MSNIKHTPGPWEVRQDYYIGRPNKVHSLAEVKCGDVPAGDIDQHKANARLIAAAPDLLAACKLWDEGFADGDEFSLEQLMAWMNGNREAARAAATKAEGR